MDAQERRLIEIFRTKTPEEKPLYLEAMILFSGLSDIQRERIWRTRLWRYSASK